MMLLTLFLGGEWLRVAIPSLGYSTKPLVIFLRSLSGFGTALLTADYSEVSHLLKLDTCPAGLNKLTL